jgi:hypothetical protein
MAKRSTCRLCGKETDRLPKDHIQPQRAFNEKHRTSVRRHSLEARRGGTAERWE